MFLDRAVKWLLPREEHFFDLLERGAERALAMSVLLVEACEVQTYPDRAALVVRMTDEEHAADKVIHDVYEALNRTFVTPIDRSDIFTLATELEGIADSIHQTGMQLVTHAMEDVPPGSTELAAKVKQACEEVQGAVRLLRTLEKMEEIRTRCKAVGALEHDGDQIFRTKIAEMFKNEKDPIRLIKHKEFLEGLENTLDICDEVATALDMLVIKNA